MSYRKHHRHSYQLIMHAERLNLSARDRLLVALISRYHRKKGPSRKHEEFAALAPEDQAIVRRMSALLRVADGLDRGHTASVERVTVSLAPERVQLDVTPRVSGADLSLECWGAERKSDVLAKALDREVRIGTPPARLTPSRATAPRRRPPSGWSTARQGAGRWVPECHPAPCVRRSRPPA